MVYPTSTHFILNKEVLENPKAWAKMPLNQKESDLTKEVKDLYSENY